MRLAAALLPLLVAAGCAGDSGPAALPADRVRAGFPPHGIADTIVVDAVDRLPLRSAELIAPDGAATPASSLTVDAAPGFTSRQQLGNDPLQGDVFGAGNVPGAAPLPVTSGGAPLTRVQLLEFVANAAIPLPDPVEYRRNWAHYRIRLVFGTPPATLQTREIAAPEPPPG